MHQLQPLSLRQILFVLMASRLSILQLTSGQYPEFR